MRRVITRQSKSARTVAWDYHQTTNAAHRALYAEAHLESRSVLGKRLTQEFTDVPQSAQLTADAAPRQSWTTWEELVNKQTQTCSSRRTFLTRSAYQDVLEAQVPLQHQLLKTSSQDYRSQRMVSRIRIHDCAQRLIDDSGLLGTSLKQKQRILAYMLHAVAPRMSTERCMELHEALCRRAEFVTGTHLAILLSHTRVKTDAAFTMLAKATDKEARFRGVVNVNLLVPMLRVLRHKRAPWGSALQLAARCAATEIPDYTWGCLCATAATLGAPLTALEGIVDRATGVDKRHFKNVFLWNAFIRFVSWEQALAMLRDNMPAYQVVPNMSTFAAVMAACCASRPPAPWHVALSLAATVPATPEMLVLSAPSATAQFTSSLRRLLIHQKRRAELRLVRQAAFPKRKTKGGL